MAGREVSIYGLYNLDEECRDLHVDGEMWTMNDWYRFWPVFAPHRIYNVHPFPHRNFETGRFGDDWKARYQAAADNGSELWTGWEIEGLPWRLINWPVMETAFGVATLSCSIAIMIYHAVLEGAKKIHLRGVRLTADEYKYQVAGILRAMSVARSWGVEIDCKYELDWLSRIGVEKPVVPWGDAENDVPYYKRVPQLGKVSDGSVGV